ncbi:MAG: hypothetical protein J2P50_03640 [Hyphomicrobiaceae bacterium]|nr:hypothetical protein [Hyphomicrobiaceae bacterium]
MDLEPSLCALLNGDRGWLVNLNTVEDGLQSINPDLTGDPDRVREYRMSNGQIDEFPESWAIARSTIIHALEYFIDHGRPAPFGAWRGW